MLGVDIKTNGLISGLPMIARYNKYLINLKGTVSDILSDPHSKMFHSQQYRLKLCLINYESISVIINFEF